MKEGAGAIQREQHKHHEDGLAMLMGTLFVALGMVIYTEAVLLVVGVVGSALLVQYVTGVPFWMLFFLLNLPSMSSPFGGSAGTEAGYVRPPRGETVATGLSGILCADVERPVLPFADFFQGRHR